MFERQVEHITESSNCDVIVMNYSVDSQHHVLPI